MRRLAVLVGGAALLVALIGTVVYAATVSSPDEDGVIHACYDKGGKGAGKVRIVTAGTACKSTENALSWRALDSLNELDGTACSINGDAGTTQLEWGADGEARFICVGAVAPECTNGDVRQCYTGPAGTEAVGLCTSGQQTCTNNAWGACQGEVTPAAETCDSEDNDCDGTADDSCVNATCGDGIVASGVEQCDDSDTDPGDGCDASCQVEQGYACDAGQPSVCANVDECSEQTDDCSANATCSDTEGSYQCTCDAGFEGDGHDSGTGCTPI